MIPDRGFGEISLTGKGQRGYFWLRPSKYVSRNLATSVAHPLFDGSSAGNGFKIFCRPFLHQLQFHSILFFSFIVNGIHKFISNFKVKLWQLYSIKGRDVLLYQGLIDVSGKNKNSEQFDLLPFIYVLLNYFYF